MKNNIEFFKLFSEEGKWVGVIQKRYLPKDEALKEFPEYKETIEELTKD